MLLTATFALMLGVAGQIADTKLARSLCQDERARLIRGKRAGGAHKLGQEPNADRVLTVLRADNGCSRPVRVSRDIGNQPPR